MKTKILATIGPASNKRDVLSKLIAAGVRIFRLNFSHGDSSSFVDLIKMIRELEIVHKTPITILQDLSGPKIRIGTFPNEGSLNVLKGDQLLLGPSSLMCNDEFPYIPLRSPRNFRRTRTGRSPCAR
ncbi:MAG: pyruvate kinase [Bilophila wadsworthia]